MIQTLEFMIQTLDLHLLKKKTMFMKKQKLERAENPVITCAFIVLLFSLFMPI